MNLKRFLCSTLSALTILSTLTPMTVQAATINAAGDGGNAVVTLDVDAPTFDVTVPTGLPIWVSADGEVTTADDVYIINNGHGSVTVSALSITAKNGWATVDTGKDLSNVPVDTAEFSMTINNETTTGADAITFDQKNWPAIAAVNDGDTDQFHLVYSATVAPQTNSVTKDIADVVFTIGWNMADVGGGSSSAAGSDFETDDLRDAIPATATSITFGKSVEGEPVPVSGDGNVVVTHEGSAYYVENIAGEKIVFPAESSSMFDGMTKLQSIDFGVDVIDTSNVWDMTRMFSECSSLKSLDLSSFDTNHVLDMRYLFYNCSSLTSVDVSSFDVRNVEYVGSVFYGCSALKTLDLSNWELDRQVSAGTVFTACKNLTSVVCKNETQKKIFGTFTSTPSNVRFTIDPDTITHSPEAINEYYSVVDDSENTGGWKLLLSTGFKSALDRTVSVAYEDWTPGTPLPAVPSTYKDKPITNFSDVFYECDLLTTLDLSNWNTENAVDMSFMFGKCENLTTLNIDNFDTGNVTNMRGMFYLCKKMTNLNLINFDTSNVESMKQMFLGSGFSTLDLSHFDTKNLKSMRSMFFNCTALTSLDLHDLDTSNVEDMKGVFSQCSKLSNLDLANWDTHSVVDMSYIFYECYALKNPDIGSFDTSNVVYMDYAFTEIGATSLDLSHLSSKNVFSMQGMFNGCRVLVSLDISGFDLSGVHETGWMFNNCTKLSTAYARTEEDCDILNATANKASNVHFTVKAA